MHKRTKLVALLALALVVPAVAGRSFGHASRFGGAHHSGASKERGARLDASDATSRPNENASEPDVEAIKARNSGPFRRLTLPQIPDGAEGRARCKLPRGASLDVPAQRACHHDDFVRNFPIKVMPQDEEANKGIVFTGEPLQNQFADNSNTYDLARIHSEKNKQFGEDDNAHLFHSDDPLPPLEFTGRPLDNNYNDDGHASLAWMDRRFGEGNDVDSNVSAGILSDPIPDSTRGQDITASHERAPEGVASRRRLLQQEDAGSDYEAAVEAELAGADYEGAEGQSATDNPNALFAASEADPAEDSNNAETDGNDGQSDVDSDASKDAAVSAADVDASLADADVVGADASTADADSTSGAAGSADDADAEDADAEETSRRRLLQEAAEATSASSEQPDAAGAEGQAAAQSSEPQAAEATAAQQSETAEATNAAESATDSDKDAAAAGAATSETTAEAATDAGAGAEASTDAAAGEQAATASAADEDAQSNVATVGDEPSVATSFSEEAQDADDKTEEPQSAATAEEPQSAATAEEPQSAATAEEPQTTSSTEEEPQLAAAVEEPSSSSADDVEEPQSASATGEGSAEASAASQSDDADNASGDEAESTPSGSAASDDDAQVGGDDDDSRSDAERIPRYQPTFSLDDLETWTDDNGSDDGDAISENRFSDPDVVSEPDANNDESGSVKWTLEHQQPQRVVETDAV